jgi:glutamate 5-kinase
MTIPDVATAKLLVIKLGSALVVDQDQAVPRHAWLGQVAADIAEARARGTQVIVVSSGAIALARRALKLTQARLRPGPKR